MSTRSVEHSARNAEEGAWINEQYPGLEAQRRYAISDGRGCEVNAVERDGEREVCIGQGGRGAIQGAGAGDGMDGDAEIAECTASDCGVEIHA